MITSEKEFKTILKRWEAEALSLIKANAPYRNGRLRASIRSKSFSNGFDISINVWYFIYTEMKWTFNRRWQKTLINPNEAWLKNTIEVLLVKWSQEIGGKISVK